MWQQRPEATQRLESGVKGWNPESWGFNLNLHTADNFDQGTLPLGGLSCVCRMFTCLPGHYPLDASSASQAVIIKNVCPCCQISPEKQNYPS